MNSNNILNTLIIGASRGIGLALAEQCVAAGQNVTATCRHSNAELNALNLQVIEQVDVGEDEGIHQLTHALTHALTKNNAEQTFDQVIHVAGILDFDDFTSVSPASMRRHFEINTIAPLRVAQALHQRINAGGRLALLSSRVGSIADNSSSNNYAYRASKCALNMVAKNLAMDLAPQGISVNVLHPGLVATDMTRGNGMAASASANMLMQRIAEIGAHNSGQFFHANGEELPW